MKLAGIHACVLGFVVSALLSWSCAGSRQPGAEEPKANGKVAAVVDPLPSWNDTAAKARILDFVRVVTDPDNPAFVERSERIATFDNDGTLWVEQPVYAEMAFALYRVKDLAKVHPEWTTQQPFQAVLEGDRDALIAAGNHGLIEIIMASHTGMSTTLFETIATEWIRDALHPKFEKPYTELAYLPQLELLRYLEANGFETFIVSGGSVEFMRTYTEETYGIPPERVIGSSIETRYEVQGGKPSLLRLPEISFIDDKAGKPIGIYKRVGRRPILAFGNSDGDFEMLQWTTMGSTGPRLGLILHHDDAEREYAYDRDSRVGQLSRALDAAPDASWVVVSMKNDWNTVFPEE
ncbi:MAG: HAD family hydrolase [Polyangiales bacterium]|jgi:phosphoglycolate phosphatase-like HAD superfamily hydrolase